MEKRKVVSTIEEINKLKNELRELFNVVEENSSRTDKISFSDGTPYTEKELKSRLLDIRFRVNSLHNYDDELGIIKAVDFDCDCYGLGAERLIQLYVADPNFIQNIIIDSHRSRANFYSSNYSEVYSPKKSIDEVLNDWYALTAEKIERSGFHNFIQVVDNYMNITCDVTQYGDRFIKAYPEYFLEDTNLPEEIKQKFYKAELTIEEYEEYKDEFDGKLVGVGIEDHTSLAWRVENRKFSELIRHDLVAMKYFQEHYRGSELERRYREFRGDDDIEEIKKKFDEILEAEINFKKNRVLNEYMGLNAIKNEELFRRRLPEFFLDDDAPAELVEAYYDETLELSDFRLNPEWIKWLEGKEPEYIKNILDEELYDWAFNNEGKELTEEVNEYLSLIYEKELRDEIIDGSKPCEYALTDVFVERNPDIFYDNLPKNLRKHFEDMDWSIKDVFELSEEDKKLLKGKQIYMAFPEGLEKEFCKVYGGDSEAFELYEKYAGLMELIVTASNIDEYESLEEMIKENAIKRIKDSPYGYSDKVSEEYKEEHSEYFLDKDAPKGLKDIFYKNGFYRDMTFKLLRNNPEYVPFLKGKHIKHLFNSDYKDLFEFCGDQDEALRLGIKYGDYVEHLLFNSRETLEKDGEELLEGRIYEYIIEHGWDYSDLGDEFKNKYPELFLMDEDIEKLSNLSDNQIKLIKSLFYNKKIDFLILRDYPQLAEIMQTKDVSILKEARATYLRDYFEGDIEAMIEIGIEYGNILLESNFRMYFENNANYGEVEDIREELDYLIRSCIIEKELLYNEDLPERFKLNNPELFLTEEDMRKIPYVQEDMFKNAFYSREITLEMLKDYPELKEVIYNKLLIVCGGNRGWILEKFNLLLSDKRKAYDLITGKLAEKLDEVAGSNDFEEDLDKVVTFYKECGFIPDLVIVDKLPKDKIKGFALNRKLWAKIVKERENLNSDYLGSLLEAAMVMGVFETKEFNRNGKVMIQGDGEKGYRRLQEFLSYVPRYIGNSYIAGEENCEEAKGCIKLRGDFFEEMLYEKLEDVAIDCDLIEEFIEGELDDYDIRRILRDVEYNIDEEDCFVKGENDFYSCTVDRDIDKKIKMMFKTIGIKDDFVLTPDEADFIEKFDISNAFRIMDGDSITYKFNISKKDDKFVIGEDYDISEEESRENKKLFDFIKFIMAEYGLEAEAARLGANNDRSNIDLVLSFEQMDTLKKAVDKISNSALDRYSAETNLWKVKEEANINYVTNDRIHQIFDGLKMEYNREFSQFLIDNMETVIRFGDMYPNINSIQEKVIELSKDPDYANQEITPIVVLRALSEISYNNTKVGFEKGKELAQKFAFGQEYYELAQEIWDDARKRESSTIPRVQGQDGRCSYEVLRLDDATGIYAGNITNCCQKLGGVGETAMLHSMKEKHGRVFVVRDENKKIIAQSWLWRNGDTICFDNVEIPINADNKENQDAIYAVLKKVAKELCDKDAEVVAGLLEEGKIDKETAKRMRAKKVTVGKGNTDINEIARNDNEELEDDECKEPIGADKYYKGTDEDELYIYDSREQVVLYKENNYEKEENQVNIPIHFDDNTTKNCLDLTNSELRMMRNIEEEVQEDSQIDTIVGLLEEYEVEPEELNVFIGTDWFMLYSEKDEEITVHKMLKSPSSGIMKKSVREQREAVKMLMDKGKNISMEFENDRVHRAAKSMVGYMQKRYTMKVADEGTRISLSEIGQR